VSREFAVAGRWLGPWDGLASRPATAPASGEQRLAGDRQDRAPLRGADGGVRRRDAARQSSQRAEALRCKASIRQSAASQGSASARSEACGVTRTAFRRPASAPRSGALS